MANVPKLIHMIDRTLIRTTSYLEAFNELEGLYQFRLADPENGRAIAVTGQSRTGKTHWTRGVIETFQNKQRPKVLYVQVPANPTLKAVATAILREMNDPFADKTRYNTAQITDRVANLFKSIGYAFIILDEAHHIAPMGKNRVIWEAAEWLKSLMNRGVFLVLVGLPGIEAIVGGNSQLQNRTIGHAQMKTIDYENPLSRRFVRDLLTKYDEILVDPKHGFPEASNLIDFAERMNDASSGYFGRLSTLVQSATYFASSDKSAKCVGIRHLEKAFDSVNLDQGWGRFNPFRPKKKRQAAAA